MQETRQEHRWFQLGIAAPLTVIFLVTLFHALLLLYVPYGYIIDAMLFLCNYFFDKAAYNGKGRALKYPRQAPWLEDIRQYFPIQVRQEEEFDGTKAHIFGIHPHGILGMSSWLTFAVDSAGFARKNHDMEIRYGTIGLSFLIPFWKDALLALGFIDISFSSLKAALYRNISICINVGGAAGALNAHPNTYDIILHRRRGFIRLALETGAPLVPVFCFGETSLYAQLPNPEGGVVRQIQNALIKFLSFSTPVIMGRGFYPFPWGFLPKKIPLYVVVGAPVEVPTIATPTKEQIDEYHKVYTKKLQELYDKHAEKYHKEILPPELQLEKTPKLRIVS